LATFSQQMLISGRDYVLKISSEENFQSIFHLRKKYLAPGLPAELGNNSKLYFAMKDPKTRNYCIVGDATPSFAGRLYVSSKNEMEFSEDNKWPFVIELKDLREYPERFSAESVFPLELTKKIPGQHPFGIKISSTEGKFAKERIAKLLIETFREL
jgi:hypothetical protein